MTISLSANTPPMQRMRAMVAKLDDATLLGSLTMVPYSERESPEVKISRAVMIDEYIARFGEDEGDALMDALGL